METIKNYLDSMFRNLPQTEKVMRAKSELFQMMEDKYTELIKEGKSENEAVGTVIAEFGNLEELAVTLGIADIFFKTKEEDINRRVLTFDEIKGFLSASAKKAQFIGIGILLCICCVTGPIFTHVLGFNDNYGVIAMFVILAAAVGMFIISGSTREPWHFMNTEPCTLDKVGQDYVMEKRRENFSAYTTKLTIGIVLCIISVTPPIFFDGKGIWDKLSAALLFVFVGAGVYLIVSAAMVKNSFSTLLNLRNQTGKLKMEAKYKNKTVETIMSVYWQTITCLYLCVSFLSSAWEMTWLIWPIAAIICKIIETAGTDDKKSNFKDEDVYNL